MTIANNPFNGLFPDEIMQGYVVLMILLVIGGTIIDMIHKQSAKYFFETSKKQQANATRSVSGGQKLGVMFSVLINEVLTSGEFKSPMRRISHLFTMYGFIFFVVSTAVLIFGYPTQAEAGVWPMLWHIGAASLAFGGYWFWFFIRVDVSAEGHKWYQLAKADLFIVSALMTVTWALVWSLNGAGKEGLNALFLALFVISSTTLFSTVLWSKFAHMFFKPAAAFQKHITKLDGSQENLPDVGEMNDPAIQARYPDIPEYMGTNPPNMGLGIKSEVPRHY